MHIVTVLRIVPNTTEEIEIAEDGSSIDREWVGLRLNEFDEHALEEAILLKEAHGAKVTALAIDGEGVERMMRSAIARGVDEAIKIEHQGDAPPQSAEAAPIIAAAVRALGADLVLTGVQTPEDWFGQLAPMLAAKLDWPCASAVTGVALGDGTVETQQEYSGGHSARIELKLPAVLGVQTASQPIRYVSGTKLRQAMSSDALRTAAAEDGPGDPHATLRGFANREAGGGAEMIEGDAEAIAERIRSILVERSIIKA